MKRGMVCALAACLLVLTACSRQEGGSWVVCSRPEEEASSSSAFEEPAAEEETSGEAKMDGTEEEEEQMKLYLEVGSETFTVLLPRLWQSWPRRSLLPYRWRTMPVLKRWGRWAEACRRRTGR